MIKNVIFDCDSTVTHAEGIDLLADMNNVWEEVSSLTHMSMERSSLSLDIYEKRLQLVNPTLEQVQDLGDLYIANLARDAKEVIRLLHDAGRNIFMVTGALQPAVNYLAQYLGIDYRHVFSVEIYFNQAGEYEGFDKSSPLVAKGGKSRIVKQIKDDHGSSALIGDGSNDIEAMSDVDLFIGYGGAVKREKVFDASEIYIECNSFAPLIPLLMEENELEQYTKGTFKELIEHGVALLSDSVVKKA